ncbi:unnamed protein product [Parajaminaea phylloscopi]
MRMSATKLPVTRSLSIRGPRRCSRGYLARSRWSCSVDLTESGGGGGDAGARPPARRLVPGAPEAALCHVASTRLARARARAPFPFPGPGAEIPIAPHQIRSTGGRRHRSITGEFELPSTGRDSVQANLQADSRPLCDVKTLCNTAAESMMSPRAGARAGEIQLTLALLKPTVCSYQPEVSAVLRRIKQEKLDIVRTRRMFWTEEEAREFYGEHTGKFYFPRLVAAMTSGPFLALALAGPDAISRWRALLGPTKVYRGKWSEPHPVGLRALYGISDTRNGFHGSDSIDTARRELGLVFEGWDTQWWLDRERDKAAGSGSSQ